MTWKLLSTSCEIINALNSSEDPEAAEEVVTLQEALGIFALSGLKAMPKK